MSDIVRIDFYGDELFGFEDGGKPYVIPKRICEALGVSWSPQHNKLTQSKLFQPHTKYHDIVTVTGKKNVLGLDLDYLPAWLGSISTEKVAIGSQPKLLRYQRECAGALREYWLGSGYAVNPRRADVALSPEVQAMVQSITALAQMQQSILGQYQQHTEAIATIQQKVEELEFRQDTNTGFYAVIAYAKKHGFRVSRFHAQSIGVRATKLCRQRGIEPGKVSDEHWVTVNTYPEDILQEIWPQVMGQ